MVECTNMTDEELLERVLEQREYFSCIVTRYEEKLRRYIRRIMPGAGEDTDDILQDVFLKVYVNARGFDPALSFSSWVYRIAHNEAVSWLRKKKARPDTVELGEDDFQTFASSLDMAMTDTEAALTKDEVGRVLALLPEKYRAALVLHFLMGKSYEEMRDILAVPSGTVATRIHRAKQKFTSLYQHHHD
jgi:RNA polymerase sigma-70 factor (ECF subfamily)